MRSVKETLHGKLREPVTVATFNEREPAEPLRGRLEETGVQAEILDETGLQRYFFFSRPLAGIRLRVDKKDFERAEGLLKQWHQASGVLNNAIRCPECGSSRLEYPQFSRRFTWGGIAAVFASLGFFEKKFFCRHCQYTWPTQIKLWPERDILGWPRAKQDHPPHQPASKSDFNS